MTLSNIDNFNYPLNLELEFDSDSEFESQSNAKYRLSITTLWCKEFHGYDERSSYNINNYWICNYNFSYCEFFGNINQLLYQYYNNLKSSLNLNKINIQNKRFNINQISNSRILSPFYYPKLDIIQIIYLPNPGLEAVAIIKTFWLKLIQRRWKKLYQQRIKILKKRKYSNNLKYREINGKWPNKINNLPNIKQIINFI